MATGRNVSVGAEAIEPVAAPVEGVEKGTTPVEVSKAENMGEVVEISEADVGAVEEVLGEPEINFPPLEDKGVIEYVGKIVKELSKIGGLEFYHAAKAKYWCWSYGKAKACVNLRVSKTSGRLGVATLVNGKRLMLRYAITKDGIFEGDKRLSLKDLVKAVRKYTKDRGWT